MRDAGLVCSLEKGRCKSRKIKKQLPGRSRCRETGKRAPTALRFPRPRCIPVQDVSRLCAINYPFA